MIKSSKGPEMRITVRAVEMLKYCSVLACALAAAACSPSAPEASKPAATANTEVPQIPFVANDPVHALITVPPGAPADYQQRLAALHQAPGVANVLVLKAEPSKDGPAFEAIAVVAFEDEASLEDWMVGDGAKPGALKIKRADILAQDVAPDAHALASSSFYVVNHYEPLVTPADYKIYTQKYVVPNMAHQKSTGAMVAYTMYIEREPDGVKPKAVLFKQYRSPEDKVRGEAAKAEYKRDVLLKQPEWKQLDATRDTIRVDLTSTPSRPLS
jgi:hypothetical protein